MLLVPSASKVGILGRYVARLKRYVVNLLTVLSLLVFTTAGVLWVCVQWRDVDLFELGRVENREKGITGRIRLVACRAGFVPTMRVYLNGRLTCSRPATQPSGALLAIPFWPFLVFPLLMPLYWWTSLAVERKKHWLARGLCVGCGYDLRASPGRCPECGLPVVRRPLLAPQSDVERVIRPRARSALRLAFQVSVGLLLLTLILMVAVLTGQWFRPPEPGKALTFRVAAGVVLGVPMATYAMMCLAFLGSWRHRWVIGAAGIDLYEPGAPPCHVRWDCVGEICHESRALSMRDACGKLIDVMYSVSQDDGAVMQRLWHEHRTTGPGVTNPSPGGPCSG